MPGIVETSLPHARPWGWCDLRTAHRSTPHRVSRWNTNGSLSLWIGCFFAASLLITGCDLLEHSPRAESPAIPPSSSPTKLPRVITLAPHLTEWVYALGGQGQLIATVEHSDFPPSAQALPRIGNAFALNLEQIVALRPDAVLYWAEGGAQLQIERIRVLGITAVPIRIVSLDDLPLAAERICDVLECPNQQQIAEQLRAGIKRLRSTYQDNPPRRTFLQIGEQPLWTLGGAHLLSDALRPCGVINVFESLTPPAAAISREQVIALRPEIVLLNQHPQDGDWAQHWSTWWTPGRPDAPRFITLNPDLSLRPGPRILDAVEYVCNALAHQ